MIDLNSYFGGFLVIFSNSVSFWAREMFFFLKWVRISPEINWYTYFLGWDGKIRVWTALLMQFKTMLMPFFVLLLIVSWWTCPRRLYVSGVFLDFRCRIRLVGAGLAYCRWYQSNSCEFLTYLKKKNIFLAQKLTKLEHFKENLSNFQWKISQTQN